MEENNGFKIKPTEYRTWVAFAHEFCKGCVYETGTFGNEDKRISECLGCKDVQDHYYYRNRGVSLSMKKNKEGKNIIEAVD